jgi:hypothetical protein
MEFWQKPGGLRITHFVRFFWRSTYTHGSGKMLLRRVQIGSSRILSASLSSSEYLVRPGCWIKPTTTSFPHGEEETFQVTHPFHPLFGKTYSILQCQHNWQEKRVYYQNEAGALCSLPLEWTNLAPIDPFVQISAGRATFRVADLLELSRQLASLTSKPNK